MVLPLKPAPGVSIQLIDMKKSFYFSLSFLLFPAIVFAEVAHDRFLFDPTENSAKIVLEMAVNNYDEDINCGGLGFWGVQAIEHKTGNRVFGAPRFVSAENLSQEFELDLPEGDYEEITFTCSDDGENEAFQFGSIENNLGGDQIIFTASAEVALIVEDTNAPSITAPIPAEIIEEIEVEIEAEAEPVIQEEVFEESALSSELTENEIVTAPF